MNCFSLRTEIEHRPAPSASHRSHLHFPFVPQVQPTGLRLESFKHASFIHASCCSLQVEPRIMNGTSRRCTNLAASSPLATWRPPRAVWIYCGHTSRRPTLPDHERAACDLLRRVGRAREGERENLCYRLPGRLSYICSGTGGNPQAPPVALRS